MFLTSRDQFDFKPMWESTVMLQGEVVYEDREVGCVTVEDGFVFDLASYGRLGRAVFDRLDKSMRPAALHDWLYRNQPSHVSRGAADRIYREALLLEGESQLAVWTQWTAVRALGWVPWRKRAKAK